MGWKLSVGTLSCFAFALLIVNSGPIVQDVKTASSTDIGEGKYVPVAKGVIDGSLIQRDPRFRKLALGGVAPLLQVSNGILRTFPGGVPFVSATFYDQETLFVASYNALWRIDLKGGIVTELVPEIAGSAGPEKLRTTYRWVPTGLYWHERLKRLFVANYLSKNILVFR